MTYYFLWFTFSDYPSDLHLLITPLVSSDYPLWFTSSDYPFDLHLLITPLIYIFWLPLWFTSSDYPFDLHLLITPLIYIFWLPLWFTSSGYPFDLHLLITPLIYIFWLPLWYLQTCLIIINGQCFKYFSVIIDLTVYQIIVNLWVTKFRVKFPTKTIFLIS
jgi:hypothetical protein